VSPWLELAARDRRLAEVIDDDLQPRVAVRQPRNVPEVPREDGGDLEYELVPGEQCEALADSVARQPVRVRLIVHQMAYAAKRGVVHPALER
jgi:hypothetical protein